jgi:hypothetical protein
VLFVRHGEGRNTRPIKGRHPFLPARARQHRRPPWLPWQPLLTKSLLHSNAAPSKHPRASPSIHVSSHHHQLLCCGRSPESLLQRPLLWPHTVTGAASPPIPPPYFPGELERLPDHFLGHPRRRLVGFLPPCRRPRMRGNIASNLFFPGSFPRTEGISMRAKSYPRAGMQKRFL